MSKNVMSPLVLSSAAETPTVALSLVETNWTESTLAVTPWKPSSAIFASSTLLRLVSFPYTGAGLTFLSDSFCTTASTESRSMTLLANTVSTWEEPLVATTFRYLPAAAAGTVMLAPSAPSSWTNCPSTASETNHEKATPSSTFTPLMVFESARLD